MLNIIIDQFKVNSLKQKIERSSNGFHSFSVEFSQDDQRYSANERSVILAIVEKGKLDIRLAREGKPMSKLSEEEVKTIKAQLTA